MRGGVSKILSEILPLIASSPHAWGCFRPMPLCQSVLFVFPTCVGVFPLTQSIGEFSFGLPHMRGGVSVMGVFDTALGSSSPHAWGCFLVTVRWGICARVFPTCVGVFLK